MPRERLSVRKIREILRLRLGLGLSAREVARSCKISHSTVLEYERRARSAGLGWPLPEDVDDAQLERIICGPPAQKSGRREMPDIGYLAAEIKKRHVTLNLLWLEYKAANPNGYQYTQFREHYRREKKKLDVVLRQEHRAGEKLFTDYAGDTVPIVDSRTGEITPAYIFVATLGASNYTFAEAVDDLSLPSWISSHIRAFEFFGATAQIIVPDNTKCAVIKPDRYEPDVNPAFADMAALRNRTFFSIRELNQAIAQLLERLNTRKFKKMNSTRRELFETLDKPAMRPLPPTRYEFLEWKTAKVGIDYHIVADKHFYSVPYQLVGEQVDVRLSQSTVEILYKNRRVASHVRSFVEGGFTTNTDHMSASHRAHLEWTPSRIIAWAKKTGPSTAALVEKIMKSRPHPEMGYRSCLGIIRLAKQYGADRVEAAAIRALSCDVRSYKSVKSILDRGLDKVPPKDEMSPAFTRPVHSNIRGSDYYN